VAARFPEAFKDEDGEEGPPVADRHLFDGPRVIEMVLILAAWGMAIALIARFSARAC